MSKSEPIQNQSKTNKLNKTQALYDKEENIQTRFDPDSLQGRTFISKPDDLGNTKRLKIVEALYKQEAGRRNNPKLIKFKVSCYKNQFKDIMTYNELMNMIEDQEKHDDKTIWHFRKIVRHRITKRKPDIAIEWEVGETTYEPIISFIQDSNENKFICAQYAKKKVS